MFQRHLERFINFARATVALDPLTGSRGDSTEASIEVIKSALIHWLKQDPINYTTLSLSDRLEDQQTPFVRRALRFENSDDYRANLVTFLRSSMNYHLGRKEYDRALEEYQLAVDVAPKATSSDLAADWQGFGGLRVEALTTAITALRNGTAPPQQSDFQMKAEDLERKKNIGQLFGEQALDWKPQILPLLVNISGDLRPHFIEHQSALTETCNRLNERLLDDISNTMGVPPPPPLFRDVGDYLPAGTYVIELQGIPVVTSESLRGVRMFPGSARDLADLGVFGPVTTNPRTGKEAVWVSLEDQPKVESAGYKLWTIEEFVFADIEAVIRRNLGDFVGHQEVVDLLKEIDHVGTLFSEIRAKELLTELTAVLKRLLNEGVPITPIMPIVELFHYLRTTKQSLLTDIVEEIRSLPLLVPKLPGNNNSYRHYRLATSLEAEIQRAICNKDAHPVLAMAQDTVWDVLVAVRLVVQHERELPSSDQADLALVVEEARLRPFVRKLLEGEFARIPVLTQRELRPKLAANTAGEIRLK